TGQRTTTALPTTIFVARSCYSPDGGTLIVGGGKEIEAWDMTGRSPAKKFAGNIRAIMSLSASSRWLAAGGWVGELKIWDLQSGKEIFETKAHPAFLFGLTFSPDGSFLATGGGDQKIHFWDVEDPEPKAAQPSVQQQRVRKLGTLQGHLHEVWS